MKGMNYRQKDTKLYWIALPYIKISLGMNKKSIQEKIHLKQILNILKKKRFI